MSFFKRKAAAAPLPAGLQNQHDAPPGVFDDPAGQFAEIYGGAQVASQRMFLVAMCAVALAVFSVIALFVVAQKSVAIPWLVEVSDSGGVVSKPVRLETVRPGDAVIKSELARWATKVFTIDSALSPRYFREANAMTKGLGEAQFTEFRVSQGVVERMTKDATLQRVPTVASVDVSQPGVAFVFLTTKESRGTSVDAAATRYRLTLKYEIIPPNTEAGILANPLGLFVTSMNVSEEGTVK